jgi:thiamine phosphate synthase YjbQ (UPF0047 family)
MVITKKISLGTRGRTDIMDITESVSAGVTDQVFITGLSLFSLSGRQLD